MITSQRPWLGFAQLWNISFGFFGLQIGFALQNANASRIFQSLGTPIGDLGMMWIAAPLTGLLMQPLVGHYSDRAWGRFGRRRPFFFAGASLSMLALFVMPNSPAIWVAATTLWVLDASINISMEPSRAFVGDMLDPAQRATGYAFQTAFIGAGAVLASLAPWVLEHGLGVANSALPGKIPDTVRFSFYFGGAALFLAVLWTVLTTREYSPEQMAGFGEEAATHETLEAEVIVAPTRGLLWIVAGSVVALLIWEGERTGNLVSAREAYFIAAAIAVFGAAQVVSQMLVAAGRGDNVLSHIVSDLATMPDTMRRLALVQFLTWGALFIMWVYLTPVISQQIYGTVDPASDAYNQAGTWVGVLIAIYSGVATGAAFLLPVLAKYIGVVRTHIFGLICGAAGYLGIFAISDKHSLILPMIGIGVAWASILSMPYVMLANALPQRKLGVYLGILNLFIVLPQLMVATIMGGVMQTYFPERPVWTMVIAAVLMATAAIATLRVPEQRPKISR